MAIKIGEVEALFRYPVKSISATISHAPFTELADADER